MTIPDREPVTVTPEDRQAYAVPDDDEIVTDQNVTMTLRMEAIRWRTARWEFREPTIGLLAVIPMQHSH